MQLSSPNAIALVKVASSLAPSFNKIRNILKGMKRVQESVPSRVGRERNFMPFWDSINAVNSEQAARLMSRNVPMEKILRGMENRYNRIINELQARGIKPSGKMPNQEGFKNMIADRIRNTGKATIPEGYTGPMHMLDGVKYADEYMKLQRGVPLDIIRNKIPLENMKHVLEEPGLRRLSQDLSFPGELDLLKDLRRRAFTLQAQRKGLNLPVTDKSYAPNFMEQFKHIIDK